MAKAGARRETKAVWMAAAVGVLVYLFVFYPGLMSADSATQWHEARTGNYTSAHPALMAMTWSLTERLLPGPGGLFVWHLLLFWAALAWLASELFDRPWLQVVFVLVIGLWPPVTNVVAHLWKDVPMLAFGLLALAALARDARTPCRACLVATVVFLTLACAYRHNALPLTIPFLWRVVQRWPRQPHAAPSSSSANARSPRHWLLTAALALLVAALAAIPNRLPQVADRPVWPLTALWDLVAISMKADELMIPASWQVGEARLPTLAAAFRPWSNTPIFDVGMLWISLYNEISPTQLADLRRAWTTAVARHPGAYFHHRLRLTAMLLGMSLTDVPASLRFAPAGFFQLPDNPPMTHRQPMLQRWWQAAGDRLANTPLFMGWCYVLVGAALAVLARRRAAHALELPLLASAALYLAPLVLVSPSAEFRYLIWPVVAVLTAGFMHLPGVHGQRT